MARDLEIPAGEKFGTLTVLHYTQHKVGSTGRKKAMVQCSCECGVEKEVCLVDLKCGSTLTCGDRQAHPILRERKHYEPRVKSGDVFGSLTVMEFIGMSPTPSGRNIPKVRVQCECGEETEVSAWDLESGKTKSCGNKAIHAGYDESWIPAFNNYYSHTYKASAAKRGLEFQLSVKDFHTITQQPCYYCGATKANTIRRKSGKRVSEFKGNGVDRVDNTRGYHLDNVVSCCFECNHAKHTMSQEQFIQLAIRIAERHTNGVEVE